MSSSRNSRGVVLIPFIAALMLVALWLIPRSGSGSNSLVVYCAHDSVYADEILKEFERQTGIHVQVRYDTEATKSLGLINLILQERWEPRCDVFWNNEMLGTVDLQSLGLLEPYQGSAWQRLPEKYRDPDGHWIGFGARLRVVIFNTEQVAADAGMLQEFLSLDTSKAAIAKPLFGTTLTHYTVLWDKWGPDRLRAWHHELKLRGVREVNGNGPVKDLVAGGTCYAGLTDTDDVFVAIDDKRPVDMLPVRVESRKTPEGTISPLDIILPEMSPVGFTEGEQGETICIPNTAAIIRGTHRLEAAQKLVDFLGSASTEILLSRSKARQIPLGPVDETQLSGEVLKLKRWAEDGVDLRPLLSARRDCLKWLKSEYLK